VKSSNDEYIHSGDVVIKGIRHDDKVNPGNYPNILIYETVEELDESEHHNSQELTKKINEIIRKTNK